MVKGSAGIQAVIDVTNLLKTNWNAVNTDNKTPLFVYDVEAINQQRIATNDYILVGLDTEIVQPLGIHADDWRHDVPITIEIFTTGFPASTTSQMLHVQNMIKEVMDILKANVRFTGYAMFYPRTIRPNKVQIRNVFSFIIDAVLVKTNPGNQ